MKYLIFAGILSGILVLVYLGVLRSGKRKELFQAVGALYLVVVFAAGLFVLLAQVDVWLPRERLTMAGWWRTDIVYVLSSDEEWTKYLDGKTHRVKIVPTKDVKPRESINDRDNWPNQTPSQLFASWN